MEHDYDKIESIMETVTGSMPEPKKTVALFTHELSQACRWYHEHMQRLIPASEWNEDDGGVLWYRLPVDEPPYVGSPLDSGWHDEPFAILLNGETRAEYFTHFQHIHTPDH